MLDNDFMEKLSSIYDGLADSMLKRIKEGNLTHQEWTGIRQFLDSQGINATAVHGSKTASIVSELPFSDEIDGDAPVRRVK
jgi:hypothetical protein